MTPVDRLRLGFLLKPLVVALLLLQIAAAVHLSFADRRRMSSHAHTRYRMHDLQEVLVHYGVDHADQCPRAMSVLVGRYLTGPLVDDWGTALAFSCTSPYSTDNALVVSAGPDRKFGTADDIRSDPMN